MSVTENGSYRTPSAPKHRQMLALLLLSANRVVSMGQFVEELWEYSPPPRAVAAVHTYVMQLRRMLKESEASPTSRDSGRIVTRDQGYLLRVRDGELDLNAYEHRIRAGRAALDAGKLDEGVRQLRAAHTMWTGPGFIDAPTGPLLRAALAAIGQTHTESVVQRMDAELRLGRHHQLLAELHALVHRDPANEELTGQLMLALYRSGRQADALGVFQRLCDVLRTELSTSPSRRIHHLITDILAGHPRLEPPSAAEFRPSLDAGVPNPHPHTTHPRTPSTTRSGAHPILLGA
ncbi:AfsR/SARP family transcriptional regulator [Streptomyces sp. ADMS]|uniref:AfsR/SARP family transcriptional regulator n=1 Tax=Streptomyces sp. ADMS TaxID=3071415 RepID=UPI00296FE2F0|nr:AfsR/SARP family transcriptional regulator [Streptomyces sp. ADMS]MDW4910078.1 AfsR/SARP family transcriptional regulator [Streptomyces sp. ADMS]